MDRISSQHASTEYVGFRGQADPLVVGEPEPPRSELLAQNAILLLQIVDDVALLLVDPAGQRDQKEPERMPERNHGRSVSEPQEGPRRAHSSYKASRSGRECRRARSSCWTLVRPDKADMFSGRQSHRGKSQEPS